MTSPSPSFFHFQKNHNSGGSENSLERDEHKMTRSRTEQKPCVSLDITRNNVKLPCNAPKFKSSPSLDSPSIAARSTSRLTVLCTVCFRPIDRPTRPEHPHVTTLCVAPSFAVQQLHQPTVRATPSFTVQHRRSPCNSAVNGPSLVDDRRIADLTSLLEKCVLLLKFNQANLQPDRLRCSLGFTKDQLVSTRPQIARVRERASSEAEAKVRAKASWRMTRIKFSTWVFTFPLCTFCLCSYDHTSYMMLRQCAKVEKLASAL
uniref:Uncharacterized protein n=1 Tax=Cucumis melo TaxID=3656 RepID=A0A9I9EKF4_CUCME